MTVVVVYRSNLQKIVSQAVLSAYKTACLEACKPQVRRRIAISVLLHKGMQLRAPHQTPRDEGLLFGSPDAPVGSADGTGSRWAA